MSRRQKHAAAKQAHAASRNDAILDPLGPSLGASGSMALFNTETGLGIAGRDVGVAYRWRSPRRLSSMEIEAITVDGIGRRGVSIRGWEATRQWGRLQAPRSPLPAEATAAALARLEQSAERLHLRSRIADLERERERWGDASLVFVTGVDASKWVCPVDPNASLCDLRVRSLRVLRGHEKDYRPTLFYDHASAEWGEVAEITMSTLALPASAEDEFLVGPLNLRSRGEVKVHASRFHRLRTIDGRSDLDAIAQPLAELRAAVRGAARMAARPAIPFVAGTTIGAQLRADRDRTRSMWGQAHAEADDGAPLLMNLEAKEQVGYVGPPGGLSIVEPITGLGFNLSAAWGIPMTLLFGISPSGLGGTGDSERDNWHNVVRKVQAELEPAILEVYKALAMELAAELREEAASAANGGNYALAAERANIARALLKMDLRWVWAPLRVLDAVEEAEWRESVSRTHKTYSDLNVIRADEIRASAYGGEGFSADITLIEDKAATTQKPVAVGTAEAALAIVQAFYAGTMPAPAARALLATLDPIYVGTAATMIVEGVTVPNPTAPTPLEQAATDAPTLEPMWTEPEIRAALQVGKRTIAKWVESGKLRAFDTGNGRRRYRKAEVVALYNGDPEAQDDAADGEEDEDEAAPLVA